MDRQCSSCGGFCKKSGCERENVKPKEWQGLTDEEIDACVHENMTLSDSRLRDAVYGVVLSTEAKLKEKNI